MKGLSLVEVSIALAILGIICGTCFFIFLQSATHFDEMEKSFSLIQQLTQGIDMIREDMLYTISSIEKVYVYVYRNDYDEHFPDGYDAWVFPTAYHKDNNKFQFKNYEPDWQGGIVYCPYKANEDSVPELRRYSFYGSYTLPFSFTNITDKYIELEDGAETPIEINRHRGTVQGGENPGNPKYRVAVSNILETKIDADVDTIVVELTSSVRGRHEKALDEKSTLYISPRN